jgi:hypothetical protein
MKSWADGFVDDASVKTETWFKDCPPFGQQVNLGTVVGYRGPTFLSEHDCVIHFARHLHEAGVPWEDMHYELSLSKWMFAAPHPAAGAVDGRWRIDLALVRQADLLKAGLPATDESFKFEAFFEFAYLGNYWTLPGADRYGAPKSGWRKVEKRSGQARVPMPGAARVSPHRFFPS